MDYLIRLPFSRARFEGGFHHLREAIELNRARLSLYARLSKGESLRFSRRMIRSERLLLPGAGFMDFLSRPFHAFGIRIGELEYVSMKSVPVFSERYPFEVESLERFRPADAGVLRVRLRAALRTRGLDGVFAEAEKLLSELAAPVAYHVMTRHVLESIARAAYLARIHSEKAKARGILDPAWLSRWFVRSQFTLLGYACRIDRELAPLQSKGIPILFQDVPAIPIRAEY